MITFDLLIRFLLYPASAYAIFVQLRKHPVSNVFLWLMTPAIVMVVGTADLLICEWLDRRRKRRSERIKEETRHE